MSRRPDGYKFKCNCGCGHQSRTFLGFIAALYETESPDDIASRMAATQNKKSTRAFVVWSDIESAWVPFNGAGEPR